MENEIEFESHDVKKEPVTQEESLKLLKKKKLFLEKKGKKVNRFSKKEIDDETLLKMFIGRSGTLRAPVLSGKTWIMAGFEEETYKELLSK